MEWVEVRGKTVEVAVAAGLAELGLASQDEADIEVLQEPERGFLGIGGQDAIVRIKEAPKKQGRRRRGRGRGGRSRTGGEERQSDAGGGRDRSSDQQRGGRSGGGRSGGGRQDRPKGDRDDAPKGDRGGRSSEGGGRGRTSDRSAEGEARSGSGRSDRGRGKQTRTGDSQDSRRDRTERAPTTGDRTTKRGAEVAEEVDIEQQRQIVHEFLEGLVEAFGVEGDVTTTIEDEIIMASVNGEQTEALVGVKGAVLQSVLELARTVVQRKSQAGARIRLDIAGYNERRREALRIYARRLADKVIDEGGEIMLEPMNAAERKVVHDAIVEIDGVRTFSEGQDPNRSVVIAPD